MRRYGLDGTLLLIQSSLLIFSCALIALLLPAAAVHGLSVGPLVDKVLDATKLIEPSRPGLNENKNNNQSSATDSRPPAMATPAEQSADYSAPVVSERQFQQNTLKQLSTVEPIEAFSSERSLTRIAYVDSTTKNSASTFEPISQTSAPLQVSNHGWKVFGVTWYWWLSGVAGVWYSIRWVGSVGWRRRANKDLLAS